MIDRKWLIGRSLGLYRCLPALILFFSIGSARRKTPSIRSAGDRNFRFFRSRKKSPPKKKKTLHLDGLVVWHWALPQFTLLLASECIGLAYKLQRVRVERESRSPSLSRRKALNIFVNCHNWASDSSNGWSRKPERDYLAVLSLYSITAALSRRTNKQV